MRHTYNLKFTKLLNHFLYYQGHLTKPDLIDDKK